ncbi:DNA cytosine methyltransferase [Rhodovulum sp. DZ06]|uniref:DNA cytosine methyltransferase n=1 Tax=Rhodovulum sp. DZ06 TaxID=3425126 RepID=UPI003D32774A
MSPRRREVLEFFAGGGMARIGLGRGWRCTFANDVDKGKCAAYRENFGDAHLVERDVARLSSADLPGRADLAWASFPCQDLSLAGGRRGMEMGGAGARSSMFWAFWFLVEILAEEGRAPKTLCVENVLGLATSNQGRDFNALCTALGRSGWYWDAHAVDAAGFVPQSRPRLFIIAWRGAEPPAALAPQADDADAAPTHPALARAIERLDPEAAAARRPLRLPAPPGTNQTLGDLLEDAPTGVKWKTKAEVNRLLSLMTPRQRARVEEARAAAQRGGQRRAGGVYRRTRKDKAGVSVQRAEVRFDVAGCLRTPAGGSSRLTLLIAEPDGSLRARLLSAREAARLMGLPDSYKLPKAYTAGYKIAGDGVAAPVVRHLAQHLIEPLCAEIDRVEAAQADRAAE